jgi:hypothetical protein
MAKGNAKNIKNADKPMILVQCPKGAAWANPTTKTEIPYRCTRCRGNHPPVLSPSGQQIDRANLESLPMDARRKIGGHALGAA